MFGTKIMGELTSLMFDLQSGSGIYSIFLAERCTTTIPSLSGRILVRAEDMFGTKIMGKLTCLMFELQSGSDIIQY